MDIRLLIVGLILGALLLLVGLPCLQEWRHRRETLLHARQVIEKWEKAIRDAKKAK